MTGETGADAPPPAEEYVAKEEAKPAAMVETKAEVKAEAKKATPAPASVAPTTAQKVSEMSDAEFRKSLGLD